MAKKVGVLLSGCGVFDGAEIYEAVLILLALDIEQVLKFPVWCPSKNFFKEIRSWKY